LGATHLNIIISNSLFFVFSTGDDFFCFPWRRRLFLFFHWRRRLLFFSSVFPLATATVFFCVCFFTGDGDCFFSTGDGDCFFFCVFPLAIEFLYIFSRLFFLFSPWQRLGIVCVPAALFPIYERVCVPSSITYDEVVSFFLYPFLFLCYNFFPSFVSIFFCVSVFLLVFLDLKFLVF